MFQTTALGISKNTHELPFNDVTQSSPPLQDCVHRIKEAFNREFDEVFRMKEAEIARIQEKNIRIKKITGQLKLEESLVQPSLDDNEQPERLLTVEVSQFQQANTQCPFQRGM